MLVITYINKVNFCEALGQLNNDIKITFLFRKCTCRSWQSGPMDRKTNVTTMITCTNAIFCTIYQNY